MTKIWSYSKKNQRLYYFLSTLATALDQFGVMIDPTQSKKVVEELSNKMSLFKTKLNEMSDEQAKAVVVEDQLQVNLTVFMLHTVPYM